MIFEPLKGESAVLIDILDSMSGGDVLLVVGSQGTVVLMSETRNYIRTRKFSLGFPITCACRVNNHIVFVSGGSLFSTTISNTSSLVMLSIPVKQFASRLVSGIVSISNSNLVLVYCSDQSIVSFDFGATSLERRSNETGEMISGILELLEDISGQQESLLARERSLDTLIQHVNTGIHAGTIKNHFGVRITPKIDGGQNFLSIVLSIPSFLTSFRLWSLSLSFSQAPLSWSMSIPFEAFQMQNKTKGTFSGFTLTYRLFMERYTLQPMTIRAYVCFHTASLVPNSFKAGERLNTGFLTSVEASQLASFFISEISLDTLDFCFRSKRTASRALKTSKMPFYYRLRHLLNASTRHSSHPSPQSMDLNFSIWTFTTWLDWKAIPEEVLISIFGPVFRSPSASSLVGGSKTSVSTYTKGITAVMETILGGMVTIQLQPLSDSDRATSSNGNAAANKGVSPKMIACSCSIQTNGLGLEEVRSSILKRVRAKALSGTAETGGSDEIAQIKLLGKGVQKEWKEVSEMEEKLAKLKFLRTQFNQGRCVSPYSKSPSQPFALSSTTETLLTPSLPEAITLHENLINQLWLVYRQLRRTLEDMYAI